MDDKVPELESIETMKLTDEIPPLSYWRRSEAKDVKEIYKLFRVPYTREMFGIDIDVSRLVELSYISLSQFNSNEQLVAFIAFCDYPNVPAVPSFCWLEWIHSLYRLEGVTTCNSLFIHLFVWSTNYANTALKVLLEVLFMSHMRLKYVIMVVPPGATTSDIFDEYFTRICPIQLTSDFTKVQTLYICMRHQFVSELKIRLAMEEDNDDLMAIFNEMNYEICDKYGEYFFAELCIYGGSNRRIIVAEDNDSAIGIMCLNNDVNVSYLNENFELVPFNGLRKPWANIDILPKYSKADAAKKSVSRYEIVKSIAIKETGSEESSVPEVQEEKVSSDTSSSSTGTSKETVEVIPLRPSYTDMSEPDPLFATVSAMHLSEIPLTRAYDIENQKSWMLEQEHLWMSNKGLISAKKKIIERISSEVCEMSNAFAVELYGLHKNYDERMAYDFLTSAFECFPYLDYCIITLPSTSRVFPLLQHFVRVNPRSESTFQHELYVAHRNSILCEPIIREATKGDSVNIQYLLEDIQGKDKIYIDYLLAMKSVCHIRAFVFTNETTVVGLALIRQVKNVSRLRATYSLDKIVEMKHHGTEQHGVIQHLVVSPIFQNHGRYFLKELNRLTGFTCLYYQLHSYEHDKEKYSIPSLLGYLIPVSPRQQVKYDFNVLGKNAPDQRLMQETVPFPLYHMNHRLSSQTKLDINTRIVIVGGTYISLAFIEHLIFGSVGCNFNINNLSLVSRHGVFTDHTFHPSCEHFIPYNGHYNFTYLSRLHLQTWVNIIYGNMTAINRDKKFIKVNDESILYYDYLFLFCEEKFLKPNVHDGLEVTYHPEVCHNSMNCREETRGPAEYPKNVFVINTPLDASFVLQNLHEIDDISQLSGYVIVYGHSYHAFCCIAALLEFGIPGNRISFVEPFPDYKAGFTNTIFNNEEVDDAVMQSIYEESILVYSGYFFHSWALSTKDYSIQKVIFTKRAKVVSVDCIALFYYPKESIEQFTFQAFREACLLFDGKLIIDHTFCTNDPSIFAAGNFTKYSDRYYSEPHSQFNPVEIGTEVANQLLKKLYLQENVSEQTEVKLPPKFFSPIIISCKLPGKINYLHIRKPGLDMPMEAAISKSDYGNVYITGSCKNCEEGYFRLHLDSHRFVRTITCYTKKEIDVYNLICLYGKHERLLNNFVLRFENKLIPDLFKYFRQSWCYGIFHDYFNEVQKQNVDEISSIKGFAGKAIIEEIGQYLKQSDWRMMSDEKKEELYAWYTKSHLRQGVEQRMATFLQDNIDLLPMYAAQRAVNRIFHMAPTSQLLQFSIHRN